MSKWLFQSKQTQKTARENSVEKSIRIFAAFQEVPLPQFSSMSIRPKEHQTTDVFGNMFVVF